MKTKNLPSQRRGTLILTFALLSVLAVSGCGKKETPKPVVNNNTNVRQVNENTNANENVNANLDQNTNSNVNENQGAGAVEDGQSGEQGEEIDTSDWLTYRNEEYRYQIKYPKDWIVFDDSGGHLPSVQFKKDVSKQEGALLRINIPQYGYGTELHKTVSTEEINLSGVKAQKIRLKILDEFNEHDGNENIIFIFFNDKKFNYESGIEFFYSEVNENYYLNIFNKIIDNFEFIST